MIEIFKQATTKSNIRGAHSGVVLESSVGMWRRVDE